MSQVQRIEGSNVDPQTTQGLAARVADPLWYLARQWQVGEFRGEDAASPVLVEAQIDSYPIEELHLGSGKSAKKVHLGALTSPLEPFVERETQAETLSVRELIQSAGRLISLLKANGLEDSVGAQLLASYRFTSSALGTTEDKVGAARLKVLAQRSFDVRKLSEDLVQIAGAMENLKALSGLSKDLVSKAAALIAQWQATEAGFAHTREKTQQSPWRDQRQEYQFAVSTGALDKDGGQIVLSAPDHTGGRLDWQRFDLVAEPKVYPRQNAQVIRGLVSPLKFAGQPAQRFWEIEEGEVYFGDLQGGASDLNRSVLGAYAAVAGDDWFGLTARIPRGHVARVRNFRVRDNFSKDWTELRSTCENDHALNRDRVWRWFEHRRTQKDFQGTRPLLFVPPVIASAERSAPFEEVHFRRDEMANLAWAIERRYPGPYGRAVEVLRPSETALPVPGVEGDWTFQLGQMVPDHWFPLVPVRLNSSSAEVMLRRGVLLDEAGEKPPRAQGRILTPEKAFLIQEAEVPLGGTQVRRRWRYARGMDGSRHLWMGRKKVPSTGAMSHSPLGFDVLSGWTKARRRE